MKDSQKKFNVTVYLTVAVTVRGIAAKNETHAAMDAVHALGFDDEEMYQRAKELLNISVPGVLSGVLPVEGAALSANAEFVDGTDGYLVETDDGKRAVALDKYGERK